MRRQGCSNIYAWVGATQYAVLDMPGIPRIWYISICIHFAGKRQKCKIFAGVLNIIPAVIVISRTVILSLLKTLLNVWKTPILRRIKFFYTAI